MLTNDDLNKIKKATTEIVNASEKRIRDDMSKLASKQDVLILGQNTKKLMEQASDAILDGMEEMFQAHVYGKRPFKITPPILSPN